MSHLEYFKIKDAMELINGLFDAALLKIVASVLFIFLSFGFDSLQHKALIALFILMWADCLTAIWAAYKSGETIKSAKIFRTPVKIVIYFGLIYFARITEYGLPELLTILDETVIAFCVVTELISIMENVNKMGYPVPTKLLSKLINVRDNQ
jgi:toxin secretion/phage lysis holin